MKIDQSERNFCITTDYFTRSSSTYTDGNAHSSSSVFLLNECHFLTLTTIMRLAGAKVIKFTGLSWFQFTLLTNEFLSNWHLDPNLMSNHRQRHRSLSTQVSDSFSSNEGCLPGKKGGSAGVMALFQMRISHKKKWIYVAWKTWYHKNVYVLNKRFFK